MTGIAGLGTYLPRYRIEASEITDAWGQFHGAGITKTAVPDADEDALTMAHEAAARALRASETAAEDIETLLVATTTPPMAEDPIDPRLASTLGLPETVRSRQFTGSTRAGTEALVAALDGPLPALVVASDAPRGEPDSETEHAAGAGAVAAVVTSDGEGTITDTAEHVTPVPGTRYRAADSTATTGLGIANYDRSAYTGALTAAIEQLDVDPAEAAAVAPQAPNGKLPYRLEGSLGIDSEQLDQGIFVDAVGDTGAASPLFGFAAALADGAGDAILVGYGSGSATALAVADPVSVVANEEQIPAHGEGLLDRTEGEQESLSYGEYLRMRREITTGEPEGGGAYVSVPSWKRTVPQRHRLVAGRCEECGTLALPPEGACTDCGTFEEFEMVRLPGTGTVEAATEIGAGGAPPEFVEQQARSGPYTSAIVALDGPDGGSVSIPAQVVEHDGDVDIGDPVEATIRRVYTQEGVIRYGFKMRPQP
jgi:hydroxymethylglutaryl-CoA synthase